MPKTAATTAAGESDWRPGNMRVLIECDRCGQIVSISGSVGRTPVARLIWGLIVLTAVTLSATFYTACRVDGTRALSLHHLEVDDGEQGIRGDIRGQRQGERER